MAKITADTIAKQVQGHLTSIGFDGMKKTKSSRKINLQDKIKGKMR
jgi:hypothetical protein